MSVKMIIVSTKNSRLLIGIVSWLWVKTLPAEDSKPVSVLCSITVFWLLRFDKRRIVLTEEGHCPLPCAENKGPVTSVSYLCL